MSAPGDTLARVLARHARERGDHPAVVDLRHGRRYTYRAFDALVSRVAHAYRAWGLRTGDRVTAVVENSPEFMALYYGAIRAGVVFNPMPYASHPDEIRKNLGFVRPELLLLDSRRQRDAADLASEQRVCWVTVAPQGGFLEDLPAGPQEVVWPEEDAPDPQAPACLYYSSGTTSDPKGVLYTHRNQIALTDSLCRGFQFGPEQIHLMILPLGHTASTNYSMLPCLYQGGTVLVAESFFVVRKIFWSLIETWKVTYVETVPTVLYTLLNLHADAGGHDLSSLPWVGCGSAPLQVSVQTRFQERFGVAVGNLYGLSETGPSHIDDPRRPGWKPGTIGLPLDVNECRIVGPEGETLPDGSVGEIALKGANVFPGYFNNPEQTARALRDGWFYTGDLGWRDGDGVFYFVDRSKDLIIKGGSNITPGEIDEVLLAHGGVREAATIGVPDPLLGEEIHSFVVLRDGVELSADALIDWCSAHLQRIKVPRKITFLDAIPKTHSGKLLRKVLRERYSHEL